MFVGCSVLQTNFGDMAETLKNLGRGAQIQGLAMFDGTASNDDMCSTGGRKATDNRSQHQSRNSSKYHWKNQSKFNGKSTQNRFRGGQGASLGLPWAAFGGPWTALETSWEALQEDLGFSLRVHPWKTLQEGLRDAATRMPLS